MSKYLELSATRMYGFNLVEAWAKAEEILGLHNSIFISEKGTVTQYIDSEEGEEFHNELKYHLDISSFEDIVGNYYEAIENKDLIGMFKALTIFDEIDNYPKIVNETIKRILMRVRTETHNEIYKHNKQKKESYIYYKEKRWNSN